MDILARARVLAPYALPVWQARQLSLSRLVARVVSLLLWKREMRVTNLMLIPAAALFTLSTYASAVEVKAEKYVHVRFHASTIQDLPSRQPGDAPPRVQPLSRTNYKFELDLFYQPGNSRAPAFVTGQFNGRRENHSWTTVDLSLQVFHVLTSIEHNRLVREMIQRLKAETGREPTVIPYASHQNGVPLDRSSAARA